MVTGEMVDKDGNESLACRNDDDDDCEGRFRGMTSPNCGDVADNVVVVVVVEKDGLVSVLLFLMS